MKDSFRNAVTLGLPLLCLLGASLHGENEEKVKVHATETMIHTSGEIQWKKNTILPKGNGTHFSAAAADFTGDGKIDVIGSVSGKTILFRGPDWKQQEIHAFSRKGRHIAAEPIDIDEDGDLDFVGGDANGDLIWLENPSKDGGTWTEHIIDDNAAGIHCIILFDVNKDGRLDVISNNFKANGPLGNSCTWYEMSKNKDGVVEWDRHIFAKGDALGGSHYIGAGDVNGDGWPDLAVAAKGKPFDGGNWFAYWNSTIFVVTNGEM